MSLPADETLLFLNWFGLIFGSFLLFFFAVRVIKGGTVSLFSLICTCAVVAWCVVCLIVPTTN